MCSTAGQESNLGQQPGLGQPQRNYTSSRLTEAHLLIWGRRSHTKAGPGTRTGRGSTAAPPCARELQVVFPAPVFMAAASSHTFLLCLSMLHSSIFLNPCSGICAFPSQHRSGFTDLPLVLLQWLREEEQHQQPSELSQAGSCRQVQPASNSHQEDGIQTFNSSSNKTQKKTILRAGFIPLLSFPSDCQNQPHLLFHHPTALSSCCHLVPLQWAVLMCTNTNHAMSRHSSCDALQTLPCNLGPTAKSTSGLREK